MKLTVVEKRFIRAMVKFMVDTNNLYIENQKTGNFIAATIDNIYSSIVNDNKWRTITDYTVSVLEDMGIEDD